MRLDLANCGGIRLLDYATGQMQTFGWGSWSDAATVGGFACLLRVDPSGSYRMMIPGASDPSRKILQADGLVYLDGIRVLRQTGETFDRGGYLGTVYHAFSFRAGGSIATLSLPTFGIHPAQYSGGLRVENLNTPGTQMFNGNTSDLFIAAYPPRYNSATVLDLDGTTADVYNWYADWLPTVVGGSQGPDVDARVRGAIGYDFYIKITRW